MGLRSRVLEPASDHWPGQAKERAPLTQQRALGKRQGIAKAWV